MGKNTVATVQEQKQNGDRITMLTCYDYSMARLMDCGVSPRCAQTGIEAFTIASICGQTDAPPSSFTMLARPSFISLPALRTASSTET